MENLDVKSAWISITNAFPILMNRPAADSRVDYNEVQAIIAKLNLGNTIQVLAMNKIEEQLHKETVPKFWTWFDLNDSNHFYQFQQAVCYLHTSFCNAKQIIDKLTLLGPFKPVYNLTCPYKVLQLMLRATVLSQMPIDHQWLIEEFYRTFLKMQDLDSSIEQCIVCSEDCCSCRDVFRDTNMKLGEMTLMEPLVGQVMTNLIYAHIEAHIRKVCQGSYDVSHIEGLESWLQSVVVTWLKKVYVTESTRTSFIQELNEKLVNYLYNTYTKIRIEQLFKIVIEYPDSLPALEDLRLCLPRTDLKEHLTVSLQKAMETRLLHPGVSTADVLTAYVATFRSLRILDPSGLLLETIIQPVHHYLRSREDTVRCVVSSLTEDGPNELTEELARGKVVEVYENGTEEEDTTNWETWTPDPIHVAPPKPNASKEDNANKLPVSRRTSDIISMLVNVYGSKELFVNEYRSLLADRLMTQFTCDTEREIRCLELLKLRFGDSQLHYCEVMLKDITDSKRINQHIKVEIDKEGDEDDIPVSALIVSAQFWPPFKDENLELHKALLEKREKFTKAFETLKGSRTLCWKNHLGVVDLEIELADRTLNLSVSPIHATIIMHFQDIATWHLDTLSKQMRVPSTVLRRKLSFWQSQGVITEAEPDVFMLQEERDYYDENIESSLVVEELEPQSAMASARDQREEELQTFWSYILGMLMNLDKLSLDRIHKMLKMFAFQGPTSECSLPELRAFLDRKVKEHQLIYANGLYRLPK